MARTTRKMQASSAPTNPKLKVQYLNFQNSRKGEVQGAGKRPLSEPLSVKELCLLLVMHICRKILLMQPEIKIGIYIFCLIFVSLICDFFPLPRTYFSKKSNIFNQYFVKLGWAWTLVIVGSFMTLTSFVICCGDSKHIRRHWYRLLISTGVWYCCTSFFIYLEKVTGTCVGGSSKYFSRTTCHAHELKWIAFDISGHAFILIYSTLVMMEEAKAMRGWERIAEFIRNNQFDDDSPLRNLNEAEIEYLKISYEKYTPYIKAIFILLACFATLWDVMLIGTILYFHTMIQKVTGGIFAILSWYVTYRFWFPQTDSPGLPGKGLFKYYVDHSKYKKPGSSMPAGPSRSILNPAER